MWMSAQNLEDKDKFKRKINDFKDKIEQKLKSPNEYETIIGLISDIVTSKITRLPSDAKNTIIKSWEAKIARYLAFLVDGGLVQRRLNIGILMSKVIDRQEEAQQNILSYLLHFRQASDTFQPKKAFHSYLMQLD